MATKNPRFTDENVAPLSFPDINKIECRNCTWRAEDRPEVGFEGATLGCCQVYSIKPHGILWKGEHCPYFVE